MTAANGRARLLHLLDIGAVVLDRADFDRLYLAKERKVNYNTLYPQASDRPQPRQDPDGTGNAYPHTPLEKRKLLNPLGPISPQNPARP